LIFSCTCDLQILMGFARLDSACHGVLPTLQYVPREETHVDSDDGQDERALILMTRTRKVDSQRRISSSISIQRTYYIHPSILPSFKPLKTLEPFMSKKANDVRDAHSRSLIITHKTPQTPFSIFALSYTQPSQVNPSNKQGDTLSRKRPSCQRSRRSHHG
jgi:hypothetical protein